MLYAALILIAVVFARHAPVGERCPAFSLSVALAANHLVCALTTAPLYLHHAVRMEAPELWSIADGALAMAALGAALRMRANAWLGWSVWALSVVQITMHLLWTASVLPEAFYTAALDRGLEGMIACFLIIGGKGVADHFGSAWSRARGWLRSVARPTRRLLACAVAKAVAS